MAANEKERGPPKGQEPEVASNSVMEVSEEFLFKAQSIQELLGLQLKSCQEKCQQLQQKARNGEATISTLESQAHLQEVRISGLQHENASLRKNYHRLEQKFRYHMKLKEEETEMLKAELAKLGGNRPSSRKRLDSYNLGPSEAPSGAANTVQTPSPGDWPGPIDGSTPVVRPQVVLSSDPRSGHMLEAATQKSDCGVVDKGSGGFLNRRPHASDWMDSDEVVVSAEKEPSRLSAESTTKVEDDRPSGPPKTLAGKTESKTVKEKTAVVTEKCASTKQSSAKPDNVEVEPSKPAPLAGSVNKPWQEQPEVDSGIPVKSTKPVTKSSTDKKSFESQNLSREDVPRTQSRLTVDQTIKASTEQSSRKKPVTDEKAMYAKTFQGKEQTPKICLASNSSEKSRPHQRPRSMSTSSVDTANSGAKRKPDEAADGHHYSKRRKHSESEATGKRDVIDLRTYMQRKKTQQDDAAVSDSDSDTNAAGRPSGDKENQTSDACEERKTKKVGTKDKLQKPSQKSTSKALPVMNDLERMKAYSAVAERRELTQKIEEKETKRARNRFLREQSQNKDSVLNNAVETVDNGQENAATDKNANKVDEVSVSSVPEKTNHVKPDFPSDRNLNGAQALDKSDACSDLGKTTSLAAKDTSSAMTTTASDIFRLLKVQPQVEPVITPSPKAVASPGRALGNFRIPLIKHHPPPCPVPPVPRAAPHVQPTMQNHPRLKLVSLKPASNTVKTAQRVTRTYNKQRDPRVPISPRKGAPRMSPSATASPRKVTVRTPVLVSPRKGKKSTKEKKANLVKLPTPEEIARAIACDGGESNDATVRTSPEHSPKEKTVSKGKSKACKDRRTSQEKVDLPDSKEANTKEKVDATSPTAPDSVPKPSSDRTTIPTDKPSEPDVFLKPVAVPAKSTAPAPLSKEAAAKSDDSLMDYAIGSTPAYTSESFPLKEDLYEGSMDCSQLGFNYEEADDIQLPPSFAGQIASSGGLNPEENANVVMQGRCSPSEDPDESLTDDEQMEVDLAGSDHDADSVSGDTKEEVLVVASGNDKHADAEKVNLENKQTSPEGDHPRNNSKNDANTAEDSVEPQAPHDLHEQQVEHSKPKGTTEGDQESQHTNVLNSAEKEHEENIVVDDEHDISDEPNKLTVDEPVKAAAVVDDDCSREERESSSDIDVETVDDTEAELPHNVSADSVAEDLSLQLSNGTESSEESSSSESTDDDEEDGNRSHTTSNSGSSSSDDSPEEDKSPRGKCTLIVESVPVEQHSSDGREEFLSPLKNMKAAEETTTPSKEKVAAGLDIQIHSTGSYSELGIDETTNDEALLANQLGQNDRQVTGTSLEDGEVSMSSCQESVNSSHVNRERKEKKAKRTRSKDSKTGADRRRSDDRDNDHSAKAVTPDLREKLRRKSGSRERPDDKDGSRRKESRSDREVDRRSNRDDGDRRPRARESLSRSGRPPRPSLRKPSRRRRSISRSRSPSRSPARVARTSSHRGTSPRRRSISRSRSPSRSPAHTPRTSNRRARSPRRGSPRASARSRLGDTSRGRRSESDRGFSRSSDEHRSRNGRPRTSSSSVKSRK